MLVRLEDVLSPSEAGSLQPPTFLLRGFFFSIFFFFPWGARAATSYDQSHCMAALLSAQGRLQPSVMLHAGVVLTGSLLCCCRR